MARLNEGDTVLLDVRESFEVAICSLPNAVHIPLAQLPQRYNELPRDKSIAALCHHGGRSARAAGFLTEAGYTVMNVAGGIDAYAAEIDPNMARY